MSLHHDDSTSTSSRLAVSLLFEIRPTTTISIHEFHNDVGAVCGYAIIGVNRVEQRTQDTALRAASVEDSGIGDAGFNRHHLWSVSQEALDPKVRSSTPGP